MNRRRELGLITLLLLLAVLLRAWDLSRLPAGFSSDELVYIRLTEAVRQGDVAVYYHAGDEQGRAGIYAIGNALVTALVGDGLLGYRVMVFWGGLLALALLYRLARRLFGPGVALIALGVMAVNLRAVLLARTATAESLVPLYVLITLYALVAAFNLYREIRFRAPGTLPFAALALLLGVSGYLHYTTLVLGPLAALFFLHLVLTKQPLSRRVWSMLMFVLVLATVVAVPYIVSTLREASASEPYVVWAERPRGVIDLIDGLLQAVGGVIWQGDARVTHNVSETPLLGPLMAVLLLLGVIRAVRHWRDPRYALLLMVLAAGLLTDSWVQRAPTFSANLVALPAIYILVGVGAVALWRALRAQGRQQWLRPLAVGLVAVLLVNVILVRARLFQDWAQDARVAEVYQASLGRLAAYLDRTPDDLPVSICAARLNVPQVAGLSTRQILPLMMHREGMNLRHSDCRGGLVLIDAGAPMRFAFADLDHRSEMPPELADWLKDGEPIPVEGLPAGSVLYLDVEQRIRDSGGYWGTLSQTYFVPEDNGQNAPAQLPVTLEQNLTFAGYDPAALNAREPGGTPVVLVTYWRVDGPLPHNLGIFAHVLAYWENPDSGERSLVLEPWAEANALDVVPAELESRDIFAQVSFIWLSDSLRPGEYALMVGAYTGSVYNRLGVLDRATGERRGQQLFLGDIDLVLSGELNLAAGGGS